MLDGTETNYVEASGYMHPRYARSHAEIGTPRALPRCGGWIVQRRIPGSEDTDGTGCYPLFSCLEWSNLYLDLESIGEDLVSLVLVADPFGEYDAAYLRRCFPDLVVPFKQHHVVDLDEPRHRVVSKHHRYYARKALRRVSVHRHPEPPSFLDAWMTLHEHLAQKRGIEGTAAFSRSAFVHQLSTPGIVLLYATFRDDPVAAMMFYLQRGVAHAHILGCSERGYAYGALYALIWSAIERFTGAVRFLNLMGVPGREDTGSEGIRQFKRGWSKELRTAWLCGRIFDRRRYEKITDAVGAVGARYFPAYRAAETMSSERPRLWRDG